MLDVRHSMPRSQTLALLTALLLTLSFGAPTPSEAQQDAGAKAYATMCSSCHQASGEGVPGMFPPLAGSEWVTGPEERLIRIILHGLTGEIEVKGEIYSGMMPPWGPSLKDAELAALATYLRSHFGNDAPPVKASTVARVRKETASRKTPWTAEELAQAMVHKK